MPRRCSIFQVFIVIFDTFVGVRVCASKKSLGIAIVIMTQKGNVQGISPANIQNVREFYWTRRLPDIDYRHTSTHLYHSMDR